MSDNTLNPMESKKKKCAICKHLISAEDVRRPTVSERHGAGVRKNQWVCEGDHKKPYKF